VWIVALVTAQIAIAVALGSQSWHIWLPSAYVVGATIDHALWVLIHECAHNLIFSARLGNRAAALTANLPLVFPASMSFCKYHLLHHRHMGELELDADLAGPAEAHMVGRSSLLKSLWLAAFVLVVGTLRPHRLTRVAFVDRWTTINLLVQAAAVIALVWRLDTTDIGRLTETASSLPLSVQGWMFAAFALAFAIGRAGDILVLRAAQPRLVQRRLPQRASRSRDGALVTAAQDSRRRAGVLRHAAVARLVDRATRRIPGRS